MDGTQEQYAYNHARNITSAMDCNGGTTTGGGMQYRYTYYDNGRLREKQASDRTLLAYTYAFSGNITSRRDLTRKV